MKTIRCLRAPMCAVVLLVSLVATAQANFFTNYGPRPRAWCGWQMRQEVWRDPGPNFNRAIEWRKYGSSAGGPAVGVIVVWPHHVGKITGRDENGQWIVRSGNDGHAVRERPRSLKGVIAYRLP